MDKLYDNTRKSIKAKWTSKRLLRYINRYNELIAKYPESANKQEAIECKKLLMSKKLEMSTGGNDENNLSGPSGSGNSSGSSGSSGSGGSGAVGGLNSNMAVFPQPSFFKENDNVDQFISQVENYFELAETVETKKKTFFLYLLDKAAAKVKNNLVDANKATYLQVVESAKTVLGKKEAQGSYVSFFNLEQGNDSATVYALRVKDLAFKAKITDIKVINTKIITGLKNQQMKFELLKKEYESFDEMFKELKFLAEICKVATGSQNNQINQVSGDKKHKYENNDKKKNKNYNKDSGYKGKNKNKKNDNQVKCFYCEKLGHIKRNCYKYKAAQTNQLAVSDQQNPSSYRPPAQQQQNQQNQQQNQPPTHKLGQLSFKQFQ